MKKLLPLIAVAAMGSGMIGGFDDRTAVQKVYSEEPTDAQRRMFTQPVKLNKKQKAKLKAKGKK